MRGDRGLWKALVASFVFAAIPALAAGSEGALENGFAYSLHVAGVPDSLRLREMSPGDSARLWDRPELEALSGRLRERLAAEGRYQATLHLILVPGPGTSSGDAWLSLDDMGHAIPGSFAAAPVERAAHAVAELSQADRAALPNAARSFARGSGGLASPEGIAAGVAAIRDDAVAAGHYAAVVEVDSIVPSGEDVRVHLRASAGPPVTLETLEIPGATTTRPRYAATLAGMKLGCPITPAALADARERLAASDLFTSVGEPRVLPGSDPGKARILIPVEEWNPNHFEGAIGLAKGGGLTGVADLALGNIAGSGRTAGARWAGLGDGRSNYALRYREPALLGRPLDLSFALDADVADSLFTQTRWNFGLGGRPARGARGTVGFGREGTVYSGVGRGSSEMWSVKGRMEFQGLAPRLNPSRGIAASIEAEGGSRIERYPGLPESKRGVLRGAANVTTAISLGGARVAALSARGERVSLGSGDFPVEALRYLGGSEGLRGHRDRAYAGSEILALNLEHRWITDPRGGRAFLFLDAGYHALDAPLGTGASLGGGSVPSSLARTELSAGWEMGYGAGIQTRMASGLAALTLGIRPGAALREATIHLRYTSSW